MLRTFEIRWFFDAPPLDQETHFPAEHSELQERTDWYALPVNPCCGIKVREGKLETKLRCANYGSRELGPLVGNVESWKKWSLAFDGHEEPPSMEELAGTGWLDVDKKRLLQRFEVSDGKVTPVAVRPANGCEFEMTELMVRNKSYFTVGFEAVGEPLALESNLATTAQFVSARGGLLLPFTLESSSGYAQWLSQFSL